MRHEVEGPSKNMLRYAGRPLVIVNRSNPVRDEQYRDVHWETEERIDTRGEVAERGTPTFDRRAESVDESIDFIVWLADDVDVTSGESDSDVPASRIEDGQRVYRVYDVFHEDNGVVRCHCVTHG